MWVEMTWCPTSINHGITTTMMGEESPILEGDVPLYVLEAAFGLGTEDPKDGSEMNAKDPKLEGDAKSPVYSAGGANWSDVEEGEIVE